MVPSLISIQQPFLNEVPNQGQPLLVEPHLSYSQDCSLKNPFSRDFANFQPHNDASGPIDVAYGWRVYTNRRKEPKFPS
jgi:hypothetical protein